MAVVTSLLAVFLLQAGAGGFPAVAAHEGTVHVVWQDDGEGNNEIYYSRSIDGASFIPPLNLSRNPGTSDLPRLVADKNSVSVVWSDTATGTYQIMLAQSEDGGKSFGPSRILSDGAASTGPPDIAVQGERLFVVWDETENDGETRIVLWDSAGTRRTITGGNRGFVPSIAVRGERLIIAWHTDFDYKQRVYAVHSSDMGTSFTEPILVSGGFERSVTPSVGIAPGGRSFIVWSDRTSGRSEVFLSGLDPSGQNDSGPKGIASPAPESIFPVIQAMGDDDIAVAWATRNSIVYARLSAAGEPKQPERSLAISDSAGVPRLAFDADVPIMVWRDWSAGGPQIVISRDGSPGRPLH